MSKNPSLDSIQKAFSVPVIDPGEIHLNGLLGKGCFGKVYLGTCRTLEVAVKVPKKQSFDEKTLSSFIKEVQIMSKIFHPNVCLFMGACTVPGHIQIVSEKLCGDLESRIHNPEIKISLVQRMQWAKEAAQGMAWLHGNIPPVIHRDLKPANILLDEHDKIKVCDFGLSHFMEEGLFDRESPKGTPLYMAPEVMQSEEISEKVDVYSMGIILWELFTREDPFPEHEDYQEFVDAVCHDNERPVLPSWAPKSLVKLYLSCVEANPTLRPSMTEIVSQMDQIIADCVQIEYESEIDSFIKDKNAALFWKTNFYPRKVVQWKKFVKRFYKTLGVTLPKDPHSVRLPPDADDEVLQKASLKQLNKYAKYSKIHASRAAAEINRRNERDSSNSLKKSLASYSVDDEVRALFCLKALLADNDEEKVSCESFGKLMGWLGPLEIPAKPNGFLDRIVDLLREVWFHGELPTQAAEKMLRVQPVGTFLIRFSNSNANCYCISKVSKNKVIKHIIIKHRPGFGFTLDDNHFDDLQDLIKAFQDKYFLQHPCPGSKFLWMFENDIAEVGGYGT